METTPQAEHFDVLIVGAGLSGIGAGYHLQQKCPNKRFIILEGRDCIGGTWDLFRYPGIRSDSDMFTLGYSFKPWTDPKAIADGPSILNYVREIRDRKRHRQEDPLPSQGEARPHGRRKMRVGPSRPNVRRARARATWCASPATSCSRAPATIATRMAIDRNLRDTMTSKARSSIRQKWPPSLDYAGKRVVVIGSGATAVTLVPAMAVTAGHVTMLQRSPSYGG